MGTDIVAGVIKAKQGPRSGERPRGFDLGDFVVEGQQIIAAARAKAEQMAADARVEAERIRQEAHRNGHEAGYQKGVEEGRAEGHREALERAAAEFEARQVQLASACESQFREVDRCKRELLLAGQRDLIVLAIAIAERVTKRIGRIDRQAVTENLLAVIDMVGKTSDMVVEVSPVDAETLQQFAPELVARRGDLKHVEVRTNDGIDPGGCVVKTRGGQIDATLETQLARLARELVPGQEATAGEEEAPGGHEDPPS